MWAGTKVPVGGPSLAKAQADLDQAESELRRDQSSYHTDCATATS